MANDKSVRDIMTPIEEYHQVDVDARLCDALGVLKRNYEKSKTCAQNRFHKTVFVTDTAQRIVGKISMYDLIRGLVPETSRSLEFPQREKHIRSSRVWEIEERAAELAERLGWLTHNFVDLVKQEAHKQIKDIMSPVHPLLKEGDTINQAIYLMFKENVRQPLVVRNDEAVGVIDLMRIFSELLAIAGPECHVNWQS